MEVKVGDVKRIDGREVTVVEVFEDGWFTGVCEDPQLSDLEIVQKALDKTWSRLSFGCGGGWLIEKDIDTVIGSGYEAESLLAWAKQTIGID